jgi:hypothetical protein
MATSTIRMTGRTSASAVSKQLRRLGYNPYGAHETRHGGYIVKDWLNGPQDTQGGRIVRVSYDGAHRELKAPASRQEREREKARLERMKDMLEDLKTIGYFVVWGWSVGTGKVDNSFLVVSGAPARLSDVPEGEEVVVAQEPAPEPVEALEAPPVTVPAELVPVKGAFPFVPLVTPEDAEDGVRTIRETAKTDPEAARRMEAHLYYLALVAVISGSDDAVDVAAVVLQTQGILLPR